MIRNFLFHRVNPERDLLWDPMDVKLFDRCINYITTHYEVVLFEQLALSDDLYKNSSFATIMFDDGYKDNIQYAAEILDKYKCPASFYVVTDCIERNIPTWTHILEYTFQHTKKREIDLPFSFLPAALHGGHYHSKEERIRYAGKLKPFLKSLPHEQRQKVLDHIREYFSDVEYPKLMMNWDDLLELKNAGHCIGSHTATHGMLGTMTDEAEIRAELTLSARKIEEKLHHRPVTISYPVGSFNEQTKKLSEEAGYRLGLAVKQQLFDPNRHDLFEVPRIELYNEPWWKTRLRITHTLENIKSLIRYR